MTDSIQFSLESFPCLKDHCIEGVTFVPLALLLEEVVTCKLNNQNCETNEIHLRNAEIKQPLMLRKGRAKKVFVQVQSQELSVSDEHANILFETSFSDCSSSQTMPEMALSAKSNKMVNRKKMYPDLLFHGDTFQADYEFIELNSKSLIVKVANYDSDPQRIKFQAQKTNLPVVLIDLAFQCAALHLTAFSNNYALPAMIQKASFFTQETLTECAYIIAEKIDNYCYNICLFNKNNKLVLALSKLVFNQSARAVDDKERDLIFKLACAKDNKE